MTKQIQFAGRITVTRPLGGDEVDPMEIQIMHTSGNQQIVRVTISPLDLMMALTGRAMLPCIVRVTPDLIGKKREATSRFVPTGDERARVLADMSAEGWTPHNDDLANHHRRCTMDGRDGHTVAFSRWVLDCLETA